MLDAVDEVRAEALDVAGELDVGQPVEDLLEHRPDLELGQVGSETEVRAAAAEGDVVVRRAGDVERVRVVEHLFVAVRRDVPEGDLVAGVDRLPAQLEVLRRGPPHVHDRRRVAQHLVDRARQQRRIGGELRPLVGVLEEEVHPVRDEVAGGLVAGHRKELEEQVELGVGQPVPLDLGLQQGADDVVARVGALRLGEFRRVHEHLGGGADRLFA